MALANKLGIQESAELARLEEKLSKKNQGQKVTGRTSSRMAV